MVVATPAHWWPPHYRTTLTTPHAYGYSRTSTRQAELAGPGHSYRGGRLLLAREAGARVESPFLHSLAAGDFAPVDLTAADYARMAELADTYGALALGTTDASVIAVAERLKLTEIATSICGIHRRPAQARELADAAAITAAARARRRDLPLQRPHDP